MNAFERLVEAVNATLKAFGAPGDHGYGTPEGQALFELHKARAALPRREGRKPLNHDLLERVFVVIVHEVQSAIECNCDLNDACVPVPGTCHHPAAVWIEDDLQLIRDIESEIGRPDFESYPAWLADFVDRKSSLLQEAVAS